MMHGAVRRLALQSMELVKLCQILTDDVFDNALIIFALLPTV